MTKRECEIVETIYVAVILLVLFVAGPIVGVYLAKQFSNYWLLDAIAFVFFMMISEVFLNSDRYIKILSLIVEEKPQTKKSFIKICMIISALLSSKYFLGFIVFVIFGFCYIEFMKATKTKKKPI